MSDINSVLVTNLGSPVTVSITAFKSGFFLPSSSILPICNAVVIDPGNPAPILEATADASDCPGFLVAVNHEDITGESIKASLSPCVKIGPPNEKRLALKEASPPSLKLDILLLIVCKYLSLNNFLVNTLSIM